MWSVSLSGLKPVTYGIKFKDAVCLATSVLGFRLWSDRHPLIWTRLKRFRKIAKSCF